jgi:Xaa-Pro aminopeptidase
MRQIYQIVLDANLVGIHQVRPGIRWSAITLAARSALLNGLQRAGLVSQKASIHELAAGGIHGVFMPHGLGHTVGVEVHDVQPADWTLQPRDILTIEPGVYFNRPIFEAARNSSVQRELINWERVDRLLDSNFGGVRIEDVVLVTASGNRVLSSDAPKLVEELEGISSSPFRLF